MFVLEKIFFSNLLSVKIFLKNRTSKLWIGACILINCHSDGIRVFPLIPVSGGFQGNRRKKQKHIFKKNDALSGS